ncbi:MAG: glycosyltransferase [Alphaproteobacteria bacterium]|nr:glycosyltransferase [Alphaproteobacteria bacterium]
MKILFVYKTCFTESFGGIEQFLHQLALPLAANGHHVTILTLADIKESNELTVANVRVVRCPISLSISSNSISLKALGIFRQMAAQHDVVHFNYPWPWGDVLSLLLPHNKPYIVSYHSDIVRQKVLRFVYWPLEQVFLARARALVATSPAYAETSANLNNHRHKTHVVPIGLADQSQTPVPESVMTHWRAVTHHKKFFLFVGALRYYKGLHIVLEALKDHDWPVVIAGTGPEEKKLKARAAQLGLKNIVWAGKITDDDKWALLRLCHAFVFPSHLRSEAFGISLLEAAMAGKPMISAELGTGTSYINAHNETGLVVPAGDAGGLAQAMQKVFDDDIFAHDCGTKARARYKNLFTADAMVKSFEKIYGQAHHA